MKFKTEFRFPKGLSLKARRTVKLATDLTLNSLPKAVTKTLNPRLTHGLTISFVSDERMKKLNTQYRGKNKTTDVLSFSQLEGVQLPTANPEVGDVLISLPQARRQAADYKAPIEEELARLIIHGVLHLFGYDHEVSTKEERRMFRKQDAILKKVLKVTRP